MYTERQKKPLKRLAFSVKSDTILLFLPSNLESLAKLFADDTSPFSTIYNHLLSAEVINKDLIKISKWGS